MTVAAATPHWGILGWSFVAGALAGLIVFFIEFGLMALRNSRGNEPRLTLGTVLVGLGTDWSFKDNWVSSVTIGSGALVGLLAASGVLKSVLGAEPKAALGLLAVAGAVAAALVAIGPLLVKVFGSNLAVPSIGGTLAAAFVTLTGTIGQIVALTWQVQNLANGTVAEALVAIGVLTGLVVFVYAARTLWYYLSTGAVAPQPAGEPVEIQAARIIAAALKQEPEPELETLSWTAPQYAQPIMLATHNSLL